jgi:hypothetical protein
MSAMNMMSQLHHAKLAEINKDEHIPLEDVPKHVRRDMERYKEAQSLCNLLSKKITLAGYEPDSGHAEGVRRPYDWRRKERLERVSKASALKTTTHIALMKCDKNSDRAKVIEGYVKALKAI